MYLLLSSRCVLNWYVLQAEVSIALCSCAIADQYPHQVMHDHRIVCGIVSRFGG